MNEAAVALSRRVPAQHALETPAPRRTFQAVVLDGVDAYETLRPDWQRLAERSGGATFFQTPEFLSAWARHFASGRRLVTLVVREDREPVMIWPLAVERHALFRVARGAGTPIGQYDELLIDPAANAAAALRAALDGLRAAVRPDLVLLERVRADGPLRAALGDTAPFGTSEGAPYVDLSRGVATALAGLKPAVAKKQRKRVRRFRKEGEVAFAVADDPETAQKWLGEALTLKRGWLKDTGRISRAFVRTGSGHCLSELASDLFGSGPAPRMIVTKLTLEGNPAAYEAGFHRDGVFYLYLRAFSPELSVFGPGNVLTEIMLGWCAENGIGHYDMLAPRSRNKGEWQSGEVAVFDFALPMTPGGRFYAEIVLKRLAPALRDGFYALPVPLRSSLAGLALRM